jgi:hypothetical protein
MFACGDVVTVMAIYENKLQKRTRVFSVSFVILPSFVRASRLAITGSLAFLRPAHIILWRME